MLACKNIANSTVSWLAMTDEAEMRVLIIEADGQLGCALAKTFALGNTVIEVVRNQAAPGQVLAERPGSTARSGSIGTHSPKRSASASASLLVAWFQ